MGRCSYLCFRGETLRTRSGRPLCALSTPRASLTPARRPLHARGRYSLARECREDRSRGCPFLPEALLPSLAPAHADAQAHSWVNTGSEPGPARAQARGPIHGAQNSTRKTNAAELMKSHAVAPRFAPGLCPPTASSPSPHPHWADASAAPPPATQCLESPVPLGLSAIWLKNSNPDSAWTQIRKKQKPNSAADGNGVSARPQAWTVRGLLSREGRQAVLPAH